MKTFLWILLAYFTFSSVWQSYLMADSKAEAVLKVKLALKEEALAKASKEKADLAAAVTKLSKATAATASTAANQVAATKTAAANAETSQAIASENGIIARQAATAAEIAAATARQQNYSILLTQIFGFLVVLVGIIFKVYTDKRDRKWALEDAARKHDVVVEKIAEVKEEAQAAYKEANGFNVKLDSVVDKNKP